MVNFKFGKTILRIIPGIPDPLPISKILLFFEKSIFENGNKEFQK